MKSVRFYGKDKPLKVEEIKVPEIRSEEVLTKVKAAGICHTDLHFLDGTLEPWKGELPLILGHEVSGEVIRTGEDVKSFKKGDRVIINNNLNCGECKYCKFGRENLCSNLDQYGFTVDGGYAEMIKVKESSLLELPEEIPFEIGSILPCSVASVYHGLVKIADLRKNDTLLINGFGGLGNSALQIAKYLEVRTLIVDVSEEKLKSASENGADFVINAAKDNVIDKVMEFTEGEGLNAAVEFVGTATSMKNALDSLGKMGRYLIIGYTSDKLEITPLNMVVNEIEILSSVAYTMEDLKEVVELVADGKIEPKISKIVSLEEIPATLEELRKGRIKGRAVAKMD